MNIILSFILLIFFILPQSNENQLTVSVTGLKPLKGDLYISLHARPEFFQVADSALMKAKIAVDEETETCFFNNVPAGKYAIAVYHDENMNGNLDANEIGIPREGYGFSSKNRVPGRPKFEQAAFDILRNDTLTVRMIYHSGPAPKKDTAK